MKSCLAILLASAASAAAAQDQPPLTVHDVHFRMKPGASNRYYPDAARHARLHGTVVALCTISAAGTLKDCAVVKEDPAGHKFGAGALRLAADMRIPLRTKDGTPTAGRKYQFEMNFTPPQRRR